MTWFLNEGGWVTMLILTLPVLTGFLGVIVGALVVRRNVVS